MSISSPFYYVELFVRFVAESRLVLDSAHVALVGNAARGATCLHIREPFTEVISEGFSSWLTLALTSWRSLLSVLSV